LSDDRIRALAEAVLTRCRDKKLMIATAESCTGGLIAGALTDIAGSSDIIERGFVTYSNRAKTEMLGVPAALIAWHGAVSAEVARAMAAGALAHAPVDLTVAVTGIAGPGGGSADKPVGLVHLATARRGGKTHSEHQIFPGDRTSIRRATVERALELLQAAAEQ
jgi:nicotinamide-nucleotide amidase